MQRSILTVASTPPRLSDFDDRAKGRRALVLCVSPVSSQGVGTESPNSPTSMFEFCSGSWVGSEVLHSRYVQQRRDRHRSMCVASPMERPSWCVVLVTGSELEMLS